MDSLTHVVLGAAVGEAFMGRQIGKRAMLWGAIAGSAPDIDAVMNFFVTDIDSLVMHRGITHSVFTALVFGPLLGWLSWKMHQFKGLLRSWMLLFTVNILMHDFLDTCNVYGTGLFTPFSEYRYSFNNIFVADPLFTLPLIVSCTAILVMRSQHPSRFKWNSAGIVISSIYMMTTFFNHFNARQALEGSLAEKGIEADDYFVAPTLFNTLLWNVVAKDSTGFYVGYYSVFDSEYLPQLNFIPQNIELLSGDINTEDTQKLILFSKGFYCFTKMDNKLLFNDLRFGQVGGWENPAAPFAFSFDLSKEAVNVMVVQRGRLDGSRRHMLLSMFRRIRGV